MILEKTVVAQQVKTTLRLPRFILSLQDLPLDRNLGPLNLNHNPRFRRVRKISKNDY